MEKSSFEIKYCPERKENVSIQVEQGKNGVIRRCLCGGECEKKECFLRYGIKQKTAF